MSLLPTFELKLSFYIFCLFVISITLQFLYVVLIYSRLAFRKIKKISPEENTQIPITVIIAARNDSDNLFNHLPLILEQDYPEFEVIVVNHQSIDESYHILNAYKMQYPHLKVVEVERSKHLGVGKKLPITLGIKAASHEHLVLTDADCQPTSNQWLKGMAQMFSEKKHLILGYGPYKSERTFLNSVIRFDTTMIAVNYFSFALSKIPYMGVGRNLAYSKTLFNSVHGFKSHYSISSGDDDLFVQEAATKTNCTIQLNPSTFCYSQAKQSWSEWFNQKSRHYSTSVKYSVIKKIMLGTYPLTVLMLLFSFVILLLDNEYSVFALLLMGIITLIKWIVFGKCFAKLKANKFIIFFPFLEILYAIFIPFLYYTSEKPNISKWK